MRHKFTRDDHRKGAEAVNDSLTPEQRSAKAVAAAKQKWANFYRKRELARRKTIAS